MTDEYQNTNAQRTETTQPSLSVDELKRTLTTNDKGKVSNTIQNCLSVFEQDPLFKGAICRNVLTGRVDIVKPIGWHRDSAVLTDTDMNYIQLYLEKNYGLLQRTNLICRSDCCQ